MIDNLRTIINTTNTVLGGRWRILLICLLWEGPKRFSDLQKDANIARRMLTLNLRALQAAGLISRIDYAETPPMVEYSLTVKGNELRPLIEELILWVNRFREQPTHTQDAFTSSFDE